MADVRSMLRAERATRRVNHPHATYTKSGALLCSVCGLGIKADSLWDRHITSRQHVINAKKAQEPASAATPAGKKRRAEESPEQDRKRSKVQNVEGVPNDFFDGDQAQEDAEVDEQEKVETAQEELNVEPSAAKIEGKDEKSTEEPPVKPAEKSVVDEDEWAAFERDMAYTEANEARGRTVLDAPADFESSALTTEELAAQAREEASAQRSRRDAETEAEKEDAARALEEEFDEMDAYEDRVKRLREKREALRQAKAEAEPEDLTAAVETKEPRSAADEDEDDQSGSEDDEDDFDDWRFRAR